MADKNSDTGLKLSYGDVMRQALQPRSIAYSIFLFRQTQFTKHLSGFYEAETPRTRDKTAHNDLSYCLFPKTTHFILPDLGMGRVFTSKHFCCCHNRRVFSAVCRRRAVYVWTRTCFAHTRYAVTLTVWIRVRQLMNLLSFQLHFVLSFLVLCLARPDLRLDGPWLGAPQQT